MPFHPCTITHYHQQHTASGQPYGGRNIAANVSYPMGTVIVLRYHGKTLRAVVADRGHFGARTFDLPDRTFRRFIGRGGRVHAEFRRVGSRKARWHRENKHHAKHGKSHRGIHALGRTSSEDRLKKAHRHRHRTGPDE